MPEDIKLPFSLASVRFDEAGLVPVVTQDSADGRVLMLAYANREALQRTLDTGRAHYWSRSRAELWEKGATSGHTQTVQSVVLDCDGDAVLYQVTASGPACHTGDESCFHNPLVGSTGEQSQPETLGAVLDRVYTVIVDRIEKQPEGSYVAKLHNAGLDRVLKKVGEEAGEVIIAAKNGSREELTLEAADLFFHTLFTLAEVGVTPADLARELEERHATRPRPE